MEARELEPDHYSVWHTWAVTNYDQLKKIDAEQDAEWKEAESIPSSHLASPIPTTSKSLLTTAPKTDIKDMKRKLTAADGAMLSDRLARRGFGLGILGTFNDRRGSMKRLYGSSSSFSNHIQRQVEQQMEDHLTPYVIEAIKGFVKSIVLGQGQKVASMLQDTLRLITLWFNYGTREGVHQELEKELDKISPDTWMAVVPQLIARMHMNSPIIGRSTMTLMIMEMDNVIMMMMMMMMMMMSFPQPFYPSIISHVSCLPHPLNASFTHLLSTHP